MERNHVTKSWESCHCVTQKRLSNLLIKRIPMQGMFVVNTEELIQINNLSVYLGLDLIISEDIVETLDPKGNHLISVLYFHEDTRNKKISCSYRCRVLIKIKDTMVPCIQIMDCDVNQLDEHNTYIATNIKADA